MSEKIDVSSCASTWIALPGMSAKGFFNPCMWKEWIYLCGCGSTAIEAFSPKTDLFTSLSPSLQSRFPSTVYISTMTSLSCIPLSTLSSWTCRGADSTLKFHVKVQDKWSNTQPVLDHARGLFFVFQRKACFCFRMKTGAQVAII